MDFFRESPSDLESNIRIIHSLPKAGPVDIYANGELISRNLSFGKYTQYIPLKSGIYELQLYPTGLYDNPLLSSTITLLPRSSSSISIVTLDDKINFFVLNDSTSVTNVANSFLRFINLSPTSPLLTLALPNNTQLFSNVEYVETTGYYQLSPGIYNFRVILSSAQAISKFISELRLVNRQFFTIYIIGLFNDTPQLGYLILKDGE